MWVLISKIGAYLVSPLSVVMLLILVGLILILFVSRLGGISIVLAAVLILVLASLPPIANHLVMGLEDQYAVRPIDQYESVDTMVILGGSINMPQGRRIDVELMESSDRVLHGFRLFKASKANNILLTGGNIDTDTWNKSEALWVAELLQEWGVPKDRIYIEGDSQTTYQNALNTAALLNKKSEIDEPVLLVTSAMHMPRSVAAFRAVGIKVIPAPTDITVLDVRNDGLFDGLPTIGALVSTTRAIHEYVGIFIYRLRGWI